MVLEVSFIVYTSLHGSDKAVPRFYCKTGIKDLSTKKIKNYSYFKKRGRVYEKVLKTARFRGFRTQPEFFYIHGR